LAREESKGRLAAYAGRIVELEAEVATLTGAGRDAEVAARLQYVIPILVEQIAAAIEGREPLIAQDMQILRNIALHVFKESMRTMASWPRKRLNAVQRGGKCGPRQVVQPASSGPWDVADSTCSISIVSAGGAEMRDAEAVSRDLMEQELQQQSAGRVVIDTFVGGEDAGPRQEAPAAACEEFAIGTPLSAASVAEEDAGLECMMDPVDGNDDNRQGKVQLTSSGSAPLEESGADPDEVRERTADPIMPRSGGLCPITPEELLQELAQAVRDKPTKGLALTRSASPGDGLIRRSGFEEPRRDEQRRSPSPQPAPAALAGQQQQPTNRHARKRAAKKAEAERVVVEREAAKAGPAAKAASKTASLERQRLARDRYRSAERLARLKEEELEAAKAALAEQQALTFLARFREAH